MATVRVLLVLAVATLLLFGVGYAVRHKPAYAASQQIDRLLASVPPSGGAVDFSQIDGFGWDALYVVGPFTPHAQIEAALGFAWDKAETVNIQRRDDINLLVFTKDGVVVASLEPRRGKLDFALAAGVARFTPQTARFQARATPQGALLLTPLIP
jgi:hypothetical protein